MARLDTLITKATVWTETGSQHATIGIKNGKIAFFGSPGFAPPADEVIDASGKIVMPGAIDSHVHLELPVGRTVSSDDFASGSRAAACGGVTTIIDFATQEKGGSLLEAIEKRLAQAQGRTAVDFSFHCAITDWNDEVRKEMGKVVRYGIPSFKLYMIYEERGWMATDGILFECFERASQIGALIGVHAENPHIINVLVKRAVDRGKRGAIQHALTRPDFTEAEAVQRAIYLASIWDARIHIFHLSTAQACAIVEEWLRQDYPVTAETCPQFLTLTDALLRRRGGHRFACCPPLRSQDDNDYLWEALEIGSVQTVATDHCSFTARQKDGWRGDFRKMLFGLPGIETLLPIMFTHGVLAGRISETTLVRSLCTNPAIIFGLYPRKGTLHIGSDADIVIIDPEREVVVRPARLHMRCDYSPYDGWRLRGFPVMTILRGRILQRDGRFVGNERGGIFIRRGR